ncbi:polyketide cyclase [Sphingomonas sp. DBB INV C78]|uniref:polyketide cyclase n=1 Tax=Sphingomonas sp. DBB INV C78 TaxID=3349434 RepID=UPI0036D3CE98
MLPSRTFSVSINREWRSLYDQIWRPEFFPKWASGLAQSELRKNDQGWLADGAEGTVRIRFTPYNDHGVMDHWVELDDGSEIYVPLRVIQNGSGAEVMLTLFRQPDMDDERFSADAKWVVRDLKRLKEVVGR